MLSTFRQMYVCFISEAQLKYVPKLRYEKPRRSLIIIINTNSTQAINGRIVGGCGIEALSSTPSTVVEEALRSRVLLFI